MSLFQLVILVIFSIEALAAVPTAGHAADDPFEVVKNKTVRLHVRANITTSLSNDSDQVGTGFFIADGYILTAAHVFGPGDWVKTTPEGQPNDPKIELAIPNENGILRPRTEIRAKLVELDRNADLALIQVSGQHYRSVTCSRKLKDDVGKMSLHGLGWNEGQWLDKIGVGAGFKAEAADVGDGQRYKIFETKASHGDSGGPIFNDAGQVVAVISAGSDQQYHDEVNFVLATPITQIRSFLNWQNVYSQTDCFSTDSICVSSPQRVLAKIYRHTGPEDSVPSFFYAYKSWVVNFLNNELASLASKVPYIRHLDTSPHALSNSNLVVIPSVSDLDDIMKQEKDALVAVWGSIVDLSRGEGTFSANEEVYYYNQRAVPVDLALRMNTLYTPETKVGVAAHQLILLYAIYLDARDHGCDDDPIINNLKMIASDRLRAIDDDRIRNQLPPDIREFSSPSAEKASIATQLQATFGVSR